MGAMRIPCISCQSFFRLDGSLVKTTGSLVRCTKCGNIFRVYPQALDDVRVTKFTNADQSLPDDPSEVEKTNVKNDPPVKTSEAMNAYRIDEIASLDAFEEEREDPEIEDIDPAELTDWDDIPEAEDNPPLKVSPLRRCWQKIKFAVSN